jgi:hypothetical protein
LNVNNAISPGQITGQQFTLYGQIGPYVGKSGTASDLLEKVITATLDASLTLPTPTTEYRICLSTVGGGTIGIYNGIEFNVSKNIGGLTTSGGPYEVTNTGTTEVNVTFVEAGNAYDPITPISGNWLTITPTVEYADNTTALYLGMPLYFTGESLGGISLNTVYYVYQIGTGGNAGKIRISEDVGLSEWYQILNNQGGIMLGTGEKYVEISNTLTDVVAADDTTMLNQVVGTPAPTFDVGGILGGYTSSIVTNGSGYAVNNVITILGTELGGTTPANDLIMTVTSINSTGGVTSTINSGTPVGQENQYYLKVINEDQVEVYSDPNMKVAVSGQNFPYVGATITTATAIDGTTEIITVTSSTDFAVNDAVVFTGNVFGDVVLAQTYYIKTKPTSTSVTISETIGGSAVNLSTSTGTMTMAKSGDYALLPQPFYFDASIVKYRNNVYQCIISNNDEDFIVGKWELLAPGSRKLNALDRIVGYYKPNKSDTEAWNQYINMPGDDLTQLVSGITYPNSIYLGNAFPPAEEYTLDTILSDQPFYPTGINLKAITYGEKYVAGSDTSTTSVINTSIDSVDWTVNQLTNTPIGVTDIIYTGSKYVVTTDNNATPVMISDNGIAWDSTITYVPIANVAPLAMNGVAYNSGTYIAAGDNIILSTDLNTWTEVFKFPNDGLTNTFNDVAYVTTGGFTGFIAVGLGQRYVNSTGITPFYVQAIDSAIIYSSTSNNATWINTQFNATTSGLNAVTSNGQLIVVVGDDGVIYTSANSINWAPQISSVTENLNAVIWDSVNSIFVAVGDNGTIITATPDVLFTSGASWTVQTSGTTEDLTSVVYNSDDGEYVAVGYNNTVVRTDDAEATWTSSANFETLPTVYTVQGDAFTAGYGPEEMVPGVVTDTVTMVVATRPGTNWDETIYQHVGYNVVSIELSPTSGSQTEYSFVDVVETSAQISVFVINRNTGLSTSIYAGIDYTVDWVNKIVTLDTPLVYVPSGISDKLRIDVYETGNGDQLVKANTETDPIRDNTVTGFQEIYVNANYSAGIYQGSGVIRPTTEPLEVTAISTSEITDAITCVNVDDFVLNGAITFSGEVFGNIVEDQVYYVKSISYVSNRITVSEVFNTSTGTAGATFALSTATGSMEAIIQVGTGTVWTPPIVYHNGTKLVLGHTATVTRTRSGTNTVTSITTGDLVENQIIRFSNTIFGGIVPLQPYYIKTLVDGNEFTISETIDENGIAGPVFPLTDETGGAIFISADYAIGLADNGISASLLLANEYDISVDYLTYTLFGQTLPIQYGYTTPETQTFTGDGSSSAFTLTNYIGDSNVTSAIVEVNGARLTNSAYSISDITNIITFNAPPSDGASIAVTSYNLTDRQYFNTQYGITGGSTTLSTITVSDTVNLVSTYDQDTPTVDSFDEDSPDIVLFDQELNYLTLGSGTTADLELNYPLVFTSPTLGGLIAGQTYYVTEILSSTDFVISTSVGGLPTVVTTDSGSMTGIVNGLTVANITSINNDIQPPEAIGICSATIATGNLIVCGSTTPLRLDQPIIFKTSIVDAGSFNPGSTYQITSLGTTDWNDIGYVGTPVVGGEFTCNSDPQTGDGTALLSNVGGVDTTGTYYFVDSIVSSTEFTIKDQYGTQITLSDSSENMVGYMGGNVAISVETGINHQLTENAFIRLDGILGSVQLNNHTYYAKIISDTQFYLYEQPYSPEISAINYPVTFASSYISGGYVWLDQLFTVADTYTKSTASSNNRISVNDASGIVPGTPIYFTKMGTTTGENILGNIEANTEYYVLDTTPETTPSEFVEGNEYEITAVGDVNWNDIGAVGTPVTGLTFIKNSTAATGTGTALALQEFTITEQRYPNEAEFVLTDATGEVSVSQFQQVNVDRLWVTVNGYRVPSSSLRINEFNNLSILTTIVTGDEVIITSMMPTATPNEEVYLLNVSTTNQASVYRANTQTRTWLVQPLRNTDSTIYLNDASHVTNNVIQNVTTPAEVDGTYTIGLTANKGVICHVAIYNNTTSALVDPSNYSLTTFETAPIVVITDGVSEDDSLTITTTEGRLIYINGEQIGFNECDLETNTLSGLTRGANGTGEQTYIPLYSEVYGLIPDNRMPDVQYNQTWNPIPGVYNTVEGDPLQISQTVGANFLKVDIS